MENWRRKNNYNRIEPQFLVFEGFDVKYEILFFIGKFGLTKSGHIVLPDTSGQGGFVQAEFAIDRTRLECSDWVNSIKDKPFIKTLSDLEDFKRALFVACRMNGIRYEQKK